MNKHLYAAAIVLAAFSFMAVGHQLFGPRHEEKLFFALQIEDQGLVVASPKLVGETGRSLSMRLVNPENPDQTRLAVALETTRKGGVYSVAFDLELDGRPQRVHGDVQLHHGEERRIELASAKGPVAVKLLVMRIDSPEFKAYMRLAQQELNQQAS